MSATLKPKVLFIGIGHLAKSLLSKKLLKSVNIHALNSKGVIKNINLKKKISNFKNDYNYIFFLIRPKTFLTSGNQFQKYLSKETLVISCMAGIKLSTIEKTLKSKKIIPSTLIIPLLAFDINLNRLGYGGGFYDRFINKLEKSKKILKIGLALSCQKINKVPTDKFDKKMNYIFTESKIYKWEYFF